MHWGQAAQYICTVVGNNVMKYEGIEAIVFQFLDPATGIPDSDNFAFTKSISRKSSWCRTR